MFASLIGNDRNKEILRRLVTRDRLTATLLFVGPEGIGKRQFALTLAKLANCRNPKTSLLDCCDRCPSCFRIDQGSHGDVKLLEPEPPSFTIKIEPAREFSADIQYRPFEGRQRFFIIDQADRLREGTANALLKTLEEPPPTSTVILITERPAALLPTISSRVQRLNFARASMVEMEGFLATNQKRPLEDTKLLARIAEGRIGRAKEIDLSDYRRVRRNLIELIELLAAGDNRYRLLKAAEYLVKQEPETFEEKLSLLMRLLRDMVLLASGQSRAEIINIDEGERLDRLSTGLGWARLIKFVEGLDQIRAGLAININQKIAIDALLQNL